MAQSTFTFTWNGGVSGFGRQVTINISRDSQSYRHQLLFYFDGVLRSTQYGVTNMATFTVPTSWMNSIPANTQGEFKVVCYTYNGSAELANPGTFIGQQTRSETLYVADTVVPTISSAALSDPTGYLAKYGAYVLGQSNIKAQISASGAYGSTISRYKLSIGTAYGVEVSYNAPTIYDINITGNIDVTATVTDTRNRSAQLTQKVNVASYAVPDLSLSNVARWNTSTDTEDDESTTVRIRVRGTIYDVNGKGLNTGSIKVETAAYGSESWTTRDTRSVGSGSFDYSVNVSGFSTNNRYQARITATDSFGETSTTTITIETAQPVMDFRANGKGLALFGVSTKDGLQLYGSEEMTGNLSVDGNSNLGGTVTLGNGVILSRKENGYDTGCRVIEVAKSQFIYNANGNKGFVRIYGSLGGWLADNNGTVDIKIPFRNLSSATDVDVSSWSSKIPVNGFRVQVNRDASGYIHVYLVIRNLYWALALCFDGYQCDFLWNQYTGTVDETPGITGTLLFESIDFCLDAYPVGSVVIRYDHTSPASLFGGTWQRISGCFLYATGSTGTIGATGGSGTHTLTVAQMPSHGHDVYWKRSSTEASGYGLVYNGNGFADRAAVTGWAGRGFVGYTGGGQAHNNNPYFINVSVWRRTA